MRYSIVGSGNIAFLVARICKELQWECSMVYGRNAATLQELANFLSCNASTRIAEANTSVDYCFICVNDSAVAEVADALSPHSNSILIHSSGTVGLDILQRKSENAALFWPIYSIVKQTVYKEVNIPCAYECSSAKAAQMIEQFLQSFTTNYFTSTLPQRQALHVAAVCTNNFTNHLLALTQDFCRQQQVSFDILIPILQQTVHNAQSGNSRDKQTGPAIRKDMLTIQKHEVLLQQQPRLLALYKVFTQSVLSYYQLI